MKYNMISFEGCEGTGKTTMSKMLKDKFDKMNIKSTLCVDIGATEIGSQIRKIVLNENTGDLDTITELLLFWAARSDTIDKIIKPRYGKEIIILDRYIDSTFAYQGYGRGINLSYIMFFEKLIAKMFIPDITFFLDMDVVKGLNRSKARLQENNIKEARMENQHIEFHQLVYRGYVERFLKNSEYSYPSRNVVRINVNNRTENAIFQEILTHLEI